MTSRHYCITTFKKPVVKQTESIRYSIFGEEKCPSTGKIHWQGYVELFKPCRIAGLKKIYDDKTLHAEIRHGTREQARDYCKKDGKFEETGRWIKGQGHRTDLESIVEDLQDGKKLSELIIEQPALYCQYRNGLKDIAAVVTKNKTKEFRKVNVTMISGPTGCGKTRRAMEEMKGEGYKIEGSKLAWWQDYDQEDCILIDEYDNDIKITELLNLLDGYQLRLNVKGSHTYANWSRVYITTNLTREQLHANAKPAHRDALFRRITNFVDLWEDEDYKTFPKCNEEVQG